VICFADPSQAEAAPHRRHGEGNHRRGHEAAGGHFFGISISAEKFLGKFLSLIF
jgi:hypothetical protein